MYKSTRKDPFYPQGGQAFIAAGNADDLYYIATTENDALEDIEKSPIPDSAS